MRLLINKSYPVNCWGLSLIIGSVLFTIVLLVGFYTPETPVRVIQLLLLILLFSGAFSWPTFLACYFLLRYYRHKEIRATAIRWRIFGFAAGGLLLTYFCFLRDVAPAAHTIAGVLSFLAALCYSVFTLPLTVHEENQSGNAADIS